MLIEFKYIINHFLFLRVEIHSGLDAFKYAYYNSCKQFHFIHFHISKMCNIIISLLEN